MAIQHVKYVVTSVVVLLMSGAQCQVLVNRPVNKAVKVGQDISWHCAALEGITLSHLNWVEYVGNPDAGQTIFLGDENVHPDNKDHYDLDRQTQDGLQYYALIIYNSVVGDAGRYVCRSLAPQNNVANAYLIVLADYLSCSDTRDPVEVEEGDEVRFDCHIAYDGLWGPELEWLQSDSPVGGEDGSIPGNKSHHYIKTVTPDDNGTHFKCQLKFDTPAEGLIPDDGDGLWYNKDAPTYTDMCDVSILTVHYNPRGISVTPDKPEFNPGEEIKCEATGNPSPEFHWIDETGDPVFSSPIITVTAEMEGDMNLTCVAWNTIKGEERNITKNFQFKVSIPTTTTTPTTTPTEATTLGPTSGGPTIEPPSGLSTGEIAGIAVGCALVVIIIIVLIVCICCRKTKKETSPPPTKPQHVDAIRTPAPTGGHPSNIYYTSENMEKPPPYDVHDSGPMNRNSDPNLLYAELALDDTPRSRKPIQYSNYDQTEYADIRRV